jgi:hypothetical protein
MKERELNRANIGMAKTTAMSGRATADEINCCLRTGKEGRFGRIASLTILRSLIAVGFVVALAPMPAQADEEERGRDKKFEALEAKVESLQATVSALESQIDTLQKQLAVVQSNKALALDPFVSVDPNPESGVIGPNIIFKGANIHIVSGSGATNDNFNFTGLGNLIIGYDEDPSTAVNAGAEVVPGPLPLPPLAPGDRGGSHNLVIGRWNRFPSAFGGFVAGQDNTIVGAGTSVSGGGANTASGTDASVCGGRLNTAGGFYSSVSGGEGNTAAGFNPGFGFGASVSGGAGNTASGTDASVCGGEGNTAFDNASTVTGGTGNNAGSFVTFQQGIGASVLGGSGNNAGGRNSVVIGGQNITDNNDNSMAPKPPFP